MWTNDDLDNLVEEWHKGDFEDSLETFICTNTGWYAQEYDIWVMTGNIPGRYDN